MSVFLYEVIRNIWFLTYFIYLETKSKRGRKKKKLDTEEEDWIPNKKPIPNNIKEEDSDHDLDDAFNNDDDFDLKKHWKVNKARTDMVESRVQAAKELGHVIKFQIPCENKDGSKIELNDYKLPLPIESYVKPPRPLVNTDLMEELSR